MKPRRFLRIVGVVVASWWIMVGGIPINMSTARAQATNADDASLNDEGSKGCYSIRCDLGGRETSERRRALVRNDN